MVAPARARTFARAATVAFTVMAASATPVRAWAQTPSQTQAQTQSPDDPGATSSTPSTPPSSSPPGQADLRAAAEAYDAGMRRYLAHDYGGASNWFESADRMAPSIIALMSAVRAHRQAGGRYHMVRAATLSLRLQSRYPRDRRAQTMARQTLESAESQLGRVRVTCGTCDVEVDGVLQSGADFFVEPGEHALRAHWSSNRTREQTVRTNAGQTSEIELSEPVPPPPPPPPRVAESDATRDREPFRFHPAVPIVGLGVSAALTVFTVISWSDALARASQLLRLAEMGAATPELERGVFAAEDRTTGLLVATLVVGSFTVGSIFVTRWVPSRPRVAASAMALPAGGVHFALGGAF